MGLKDWRDVIEMDFPDFGPVTPERVTRIQYDSRLHGGSARESTGRTWTDADYQTRRERVLSTPLP